MEQDNMKALSDRAAAAEKAAADKDSEIKALKLAAAEKAKEYEDLHNISLEQNQKIDSLTTKVSLGNNLPFKTADGIDYEVRLKSFNYNGQILKAEDLQDDSQVLKDLVKLAPEWLVPLNAPISKKKGKNS